jgi:hypothetical protein
MANAEPDPDLQINGHPESGKRTKKISKTISQLLCIKITATLNIYIQYKYHWFRCFLCPVDLFIAVEFSLLAPFTTSGSNLMWIRIRNTADLLRNIFYDIIAIGTQSLFKVIPVPAPYHQTNSITIPINLTKEKERSTFFSVQVGRICPRGFQYPDYTAGLPVLFLPLPIISSLSLTSLAPSFFSFS